MGRVEDIDFDDSQLPKRTRCKFKCVRTSTHDYGGSPNYTAEFEPVAFGSPENESFWKYTPSGKLELTTTTEQKFTAGKSYYLTLEEAD